MSEVRLRYWEIAPAGLAKMRELEHYLNTDSGLDHVLLELVRLRASLLNGCEYCAEMHASELKKTGASKEQIGRIREDALARLKEGSGRGPPCNPGHRRGTVHLRSSARADCSIAA